MQECWGRLWCWRSPAAPAGAQDAAEFYKGRQVNLVVGYGTGGGYDVYGRILGRHIGRHLPGNPTVVIQNMPGAGSLVAANYLYKVAPKDGSTFGIFARNMAMLGLVGSAQNVQFDPFKFTWLGSSSSFANDAYVLLIRRDAKAKTLAEARGPNGATILMGSTAEGTSSDVMPVLMRDMLGLNVKAIGGYRDSGVLFLAMERGEIEARGTGLSGVYANKPEWLKPGGLMQVMFVFGRETRHPDYPDAPTARELARSDADRQTDRRARGALQDVAAVRGPARRAGRPRQAAAGGVHGHAQGSAVSGRCEQGGPRRQPDRRCGDPEDRRAGVEAAQRATEVDREIPGVTAVARASARLQQSRNK